MKPERIQTSEYCTVGHPDRTCDFIASYILDKYLEADSRSRVALEVQLKERYCTISGEITSNAPYGEEDIADFAREAIDKIGYTDEYQERFGDANAICSDEVEVETHISRQSGDISQGVDRDSWGDQGLAFGYAVDEPEYGYMPKDYWLARKLGQSIAGVCGGLDVKTQVTLVDGKPVECVVAIPLAPGDDEASVVEAAKSIVGGECAVVVNGTGRYVAHGSVADCGTTGRKLVVDFYGGNSRIGGGCPWGKDPTKADVTLNVYARRKALEGMKRYGLPSMQCMISCCIGSRDIRVTLLDGENRVVETYTESNPASRVIAAPVLAEAGFGTLVAYLADDRGVEGLLGRLAAARRPEPLRLRLLDHPLDRHRSVRALQHGGRRVEERESLLGHRLGRRGCGRGLGLRGRGLRRLRRGGGFRLLRGERLAVGGQERLRRHGLAGAGGDVPSALGPAVHAHLDEVAPHLHERAVARADSCTAAHMCCVLSLSCVLVHRGLGTAHIFALIP